MGVKCCRYCVPPKRTPTCHITCEQYKTESKQTAEDNIKARNQKKHIPSSYEYNKIAYYRSVNEKKARKKRRQNNK